MPLYNNRRRTTFKRYGRKKKPALPVRYQVADIAYKGYKTAMWLKNLVNTEQKFFDIDLTHSLTWTGTIIDINDPGQGVTDQLRIGDSILNKSLTIRTYSTFDTVATVVRIMVIRDKQDTISTVSEVLEDTGTTLSVCSPLKKDNKKQFSVKYDRTFTVDAQHPLVIADFTLNNIDDHTQFQNGTTTINSGAYKFIAISNSAVAGGTPTFRGLSRHLFIDN